MSHPQFSEDISKIFVRCTYINFHIIACLRAKQALDTSQVGQLSGESSLIKRSQVVFEWLQNNQSFRDIVLLVMEENEQEHVSNLLKGILNGCHIPLSQSRYTRLESVAPTLMLIIINDEGLIAKLRTKRAISEIDRQDITQAIEDYKRNWNLIEAILRRSDYAFDCFEEALRETNQDHVANYLHEGKVIAVHAKTTQPEKDAVLSDSINKTILDESKVGPSSEEKLLTPINGYNIHPVAATPGQSIVFFIYCKTVDNVITFTKLFISGDLQSMLEVIMNRLLLKIDPGNTEKIKARLSLDYEEILAVEKYSGIADWMPVELKETTRVPNIICSTEPQAESQYEDDSCDNEGLLDKYKSDPTLITTIQTEANMIGMTSIHGMTILDKELFISSETSTSVTVVVYDSMTFSFNRRWDSMIIDRLKDLVSCNKNKCLYILESEGRHKIWRVNSNGKLINKWSAKPSHGCGLSVTDESNVILTMSYENRINEYSPNGKLIRKITLPHTIEEPWHAIKVASGQFVIGHGCCHCGSQRVSIVDEHEDISKSFRLSNINYYMLGDSMHLLVDGNGFVMVTDSENGRVLLLDSDLEFKRNILSRETHGLQHPGRILLDESNGRLFVTEGSRWNVNKILVFQF